MKTRIFWKRVLAAAAALTVAVAATGCAAKPEMKTDWTEEPHPEVTRLTKIRKRNDAHEDGAVYLLKVAGDFYLDDFVKQGGADSDEALIQFLADCAGRTDLQLTPPKIGCASFTAKTADGDALFARNYDFTKSNICIVITEANKGRHASISTADLKFLGVDVNRDLAKKDEAMVCLAAPYIPLDGMNDAGVSCSVLMTEQGKTTVATDQNTQKPDLTTTTLLRLILDYADDLEEAIEIASAYDLHDSAGTSYHYMVADASGASAILSWVNGTDAEDNDGSARQLVVTYNNNDSHIGQVEGESDFQWVTNFIILPGYYKYEWSRDGLDRYNRIYRELRATGGVVEDEEAAMDILAIIGKRAWDNSNCTVHSVVYNLSDKTALWVSNENFDDETAVFEFRLN